MRRSASLLGLTLVVMSLVIVEAASAADTCWTDPVTGQLKCTDSGARPGNTDKPKPPPKKQPGPRYVHVSTDPVIGDCHYWSNVPGGFDSWDPFFDTDVISAVVLPRCPAVAPPPVDVPATAWAIFRSWTLEPPVPSLQPLDHGITGLPTYLASPEPIEITHSETLPDGRPLSVRAHVRELRVDWGDGHHSAHDPLGADPYPGGAVTHTYRTKTCPPRYRAEHPSGGLCHPTLEFYTIAAVHRWVGEYDVGSGWVQLGSLDRTASVAYDVDEVRGVLVGTP
jgi:hypothetical protein